MSSSPCRESLVLFVRMWNIWRDSDYTRRRRSRILTCFHFTTCPALNTLSSGVASVEPTKARCLFIAITLHPSVLRNLHSFSLFLHHFTLSLSLPVPVRGEGQPPARWHLDIHTHTQCRKLYGEQSGLRTEEKELRQVSWQKHIIIQKMSPLSRGRKGTQDGINEASADLRVSPSDCPHLSKNSHLEDMKVFNVHSA